jgi:short-subunit dehydrogenase
MNQQHRPLAVVTGASSGIGFELARACVNNGYDLVVASSGPRIHEAAASLSVAGTVEAVEADLATMEGVDELYRRLAGRPVAALLANAGRGLGRAFVDQSFDEIRRVIDTNVTGTLYLIHKIAHDMRDRREGRILITGSVAGYMPGTYQAVYNGTKAMIDSFAVALRAELAEFGVSVTCLLPGATETEFFERPDLRDTKLAVSKKAPADAVARRGFEAMQRGEGTVITGWQNKVYAAMAHVLPSKVLARTHATLTRPGSARPH